MMTNSPTGRKPRPRRRLAVIGGGLLAALLLTGLAATPAELLGPGPWGADGIADAVESQARLKAMSELVVVVLQMAGVATLCLARLWPASRFGGWAGLAFAGVIVALGLAGTVCASLGSEFALFAGGAMAILLNVAILGRGRDPALAI